MAAPGAFAVTLESLGGWPEVLARLMRQEDLTAAEAAAVLDTILAGEAADSQVAAFAAALRTKGETSEEIRGLVQAMRARGEHVDLGPGLVDTCGTGGDRSGTINVSSMAALIVAASGAKVCKHGGRASSSVSGSADVFEALGVAVDLGPRGVERCVAEVGIGFCLAPRFHPAMRHAAPVRRELGVPTVFNFLGPLANPAGATRQLIGVGDPAMAPRMLDVLEANGTERAMIVYGHDGLDELSTTASSTVLETRLVPEKEGYERSTYEVDGLELGLPRARPEELRGGTSHRNAELLRAVFEGERGARRDFVLLNGAAALVVAEQAPDLPAGLELAASIVDTGAATATLDGLIRVSSEAKAAE